MKKFLMILVLGLLVCNNALGNNYTCVGALGNTSDLIKFGNKYKLLFDDRQWWPFRIYQESKELLVLGEISNEEGEHKEEIDDRVMIITVSKINGSFTQLLIDNTGKIDEEYTLTGECKIKN